MLLVVTLVVVSFVLIIDEVEVVDDCVDVLVLPVLIDVDLVPYLLKY